MKLLFGIYESYPICRFYDIILAGVAIRDEPREKEDMLARDNYSYKKYQKELARKKKAEEKKQRKLEKKAIAAAPQAWQAPSGQAAL